MSTSNRTGCHRHSAFGKEMQVADAHLDIGEVAILEMARHLFQGFAKPECHGWMRAFQRAEEIFPPEIAADVAWKTLKLIQGMRISRRSCFQFSSPNCPDCAKVLTEHERQLLGVLVASRCRQMSEARTHAMLLCEGNQTDSLLGAAKDLSDVLGERLLNGFSLRVRA
ncbi:MAG: hypothetical protein AAGD13_00460 [Pseudomonadota bacterium]